MANEINIDKLEFEPEHSNFLDDSISNFSISRTKITIPKLHGIGVSMPIEVGVGGDTYKVLGTVGVYDSIGYNSNTNAGRIPVSPFKLHKGDIIHGIRKSWTGGAQYSYIEFTKDGVKLGAQAGSDNNYFPKMYAKV